jgi:hypothetical protein
MRSMVALHTRIPRSIESEITECALTLEQLVLQIQQLNPTASMEYLGSFTPRALAQYLAHLTSAQEPRGASSRWERPGDTPAIMWFDRDDE